MCDLFKVLIGIILIVGSIIGTIEGSNVITDDIRMPYDVGILLFIGLGISMLIVGIIGIYILTI